MRTSLAGLRPVTAQAATPAGQEKQAAFLQAILAQRLGRKPMDLGGSTYQSNLPGMLTPQNTFSAQLAPTTTIDYTQATTPALANALNNAPVTGAMTAEQQLAAQQAAIANGSGPNPAQAALAQATQQNVGNQAALMAGQRGANANAGLIAREAAQQGAQTQQNAVGQAATLEAQQEQAALQAQQQIQSQIAQQGAQQQQIGNQLYGTGAQANNAQNNTAVQNYGQAQGTNAQIAQANAAAAQNTSSGILGGVGSALMSLFADGGDVEAPVSKETADTFAAGLGVKPDDPNEPKSFVTRFLRGLIPEPTPQPVSTQAPLAQGGVVKAMVSPGEVYIPPGKVAQAAQDQDPCREGEEIPGQARVSGDSLANDTVPKDLEEGGIVLPRHVTKVADAPRKERAFVRAIVAKRGLK